MEFLNLKPTQTISIDPPGGTGGPGHPHQSHLPLPTDTFPSSHPVLLHASGAGFTALWVVFGLFTAGLLGVGILSLRVEKRARIFHWLSAAVLAIAMLSYLVMATGQGVTYVPVKAPNEHKGALYHYYRQVYWARYVDWLFTTPLLLLSLAVLSGLSPAKTVLAIAADLFMVVTGLISTLTPARYNHGDRARWAFYAVSCVAFLLIWYTLFYGGVRAAKLRPSRTRGLFYLLGLMTFILWTAYPIVFALTEGANKISVNAEVIAYGVLDVAAKLGFTFLLLLVHTHGEDDTWNLPEWFVEPRRGSGVDGRGGYGAIPRDD